MVQRCSNAVGFLVLEPEPSIRTGIRVDIFDGDDPATLLARLPLTWGRRWTDPLKGTGSGEFWLHADDETLAANPGLLAYGNIARFSLDERYRFAIQIEHKDKVQVKAGGDVSRTLKITGRGVLSKLEDAVLYPTGGLAGEVERAFDGVTAGELLGPVVLEAQARGSLSAITAGYSDALDGNNAPWAQTLTITERAGTSVLRIAERVAELVADVYMTPSLELRVVNTRGVDRSVQLVDAGPVILQPAANLEELTRSEDGAIRNTLLIETPGGFVERTQGGSLTEYGRREAYLSLGNATDGDAIDKAADSVFQQSADPAAQIGAEVSDVDGARPYVDWGVGDWVLAPNEDDEPERHRVRALTVSETKEGQPRFVPELATITEELEARLERWLAAMARGTVGGTAGAVAEPVKAPVEVTEAVDAGIGDHLAGQPHFDELADLADVDLTGANAGDLLQYDGADWVPLDGTEEGDMLYRTDAGFWVAVGGTKGVDRVPTIQADGTVDWATPPGGGGTGSSGAVLEHTATASGASAHSLDASGISAGDFVLALMTTRNSNPGVISGGAAWTEWFWVDLSSNEEVRAFYKVAGGSEPGSYSWTHDAGTTTISCLAAWSGLDGTIIHRGRQSSRQSPVVLGSAQGLHIVVHQCCFAVSTVTVDNPTADLVEALNFDNNDQGTIISTRDAAFPAAQPGYTFAGGDSAFVSAAALVVE